MREIPINFDDALIIIDIQNDFCNGGSLEVPNANEIIEKSNKISNNFSNVILTQDWHPKNHISFALQHKNNAPFETINLSYGKQILWPDHCIQNTFGSDFHEKLNTDCANIIIRKGFNKNIDSYSAFFENDKKTSTGLNGYLKEKKIKRVFLIGLALDVCVKYSALDAKNLGYDTYVILDVCKGLSNESSMIASEEMKKIKINIINSYQLK